MDLGFSLTYKTLSTAQPAYLHNLISVQPLHGSTHLSSLITIAHPPLSSSLKITDCSFHYASPSLWNNLPASFRQPRLSSVTTIIHTIHDPSLPLSSTPDLKLTCSTNPSHHRPRSSPTHRTAHWTSTILHSLTSYHSALCFSSSVIFF